MTLTIDLPAATMERLRQHSLSTGKDINVCVGKAVETYLKYAAMTSHEMFAPIREEFQRSGMTDSELEKLIVDAREAD